MNGISMNLHFNLVRAVAASVLALSVGAQMAHAADASSAPPTKVSQLAGDWRMTLSGFTGCGLVSMLFDATLAKDGTASNGTLTQHGQCGDIVTSGLSFQIVSLDSSGRGTANLSCGASCGWNLEIQVSRDRGTFNMVDIDAVNPNNFISGTAVRR
jgi:hypothetical protein